MNLTSHGVKSLGEKMSFQMGFKTRQCGGLSDVETDVP